MEFDAPVPFSEAVDTLRAKSLLPTSLSSRELSALEGSLKRRAVFSARVTQADILTQLLESVTELASGDITGSSYTRAKAKMLEAIRATGYTPDEEVAGTIQDLTSDARLSLMLDTNVRDAQGYGSFIAGNDPLALDLLPGLELLRVGSPEKPRDWFERWDAALDATTTEGATSASSGRMVALKNHPVWQALGDGAGGYEDTLGNPWPPFAFNSSMVTVEVDREECVDLGIMNEDTEVPPAGETDFAEAMEIDAARFAPELAAALNNNPELRIVDGALVLR